MSNRIVVELPAEAELGPAMRALPNDRWRRFVLACNQPDTHGQVNYTEAASKSGYDTDNRGTLAGIAHTLAHDDRVQAAMLEESKRRIKAALPIATATLIEILTNVKAKDNDRMKAIGMLMDRGGMPMSTEHNVNVTKVETQAEKIENAIKLCKQLGLDPATVLGNIGYALPGLLAPTMTRLIEGELVVVEVDPYLKDFM